MKLSTSGEGTQNQNQIPTSFRENLSFNVFSGFPQVGLASLNKEERAVRSHLQLRYPELCDSKQISWRTLVGLKLSSSCQTKKPVHVYIFIVSQWPCFLASGLVLCIHIWGIDCHRKAEELGCLEGQVWQKPCIKTSPHLLPAMEGVWEAV